MASHSREELQTKQFHTDCVLCFHLFQVSLLYCLLGAKNELVLQFQRKVPKFQNVKPVSFINVLLWCNDCLGWSDVWCLLLHICKNVSNEFVYTGTQTYRTYIEFICCDIQWFGLFLELGVLNVMWLVSHSVTLCFFLIQLSFVTWSFDSLILLWLYCLS
jgi:hypothetical protein